MVSVLSTLSGTIAIKHYFSAAPGKAEGGLLCGRWAEFLLHVCVPHGLLCKALKPGRVSVSALFDGNLFAHNFLNDVYDDEALTPWS